MATAYVNGANMEISKVHMNVNLLGRNINFTSIEYGGGVRVGTSSANTRGFYGLRSTVNKAEFNCTLTVPKDELFAMQRVLQDAIGTSDLAFFGEIPITITYNQYLPNGIKEAHRLLVQLQNPTDFGAGDGDDAVSVTIECACLDVNYNPQ